MKKKNLKLEIGLLVAVVMTGVGFSCTSSCFDKPKMQDERGESKRTETPVPLTTTTKNGGTRCRGYYLRSATKGDENYNPGCYALQMNLINAARKGDLAKMRDALSEGADPEGLCDDSYPALQEAAFYGHADAVNLLLDNGAEVNRVSSVDNTALNAAASEGHIDVVKALLARGADPCYGGKGQTAGDIARARRFNEIADLLKLAEAERCK
jgi:hypothetical protein